MTGSELRTRREALGLSIEDLAREFDTLPTFIETRESFDQVPDGRIVELALDQIEAQREDEELDQRVEETLARSKAALDRSKAISDGRLKLPPAPDQALIMAAQEAVQVIGKSIEIMRHKGELPRTLQGLTAVQERLKAAIEGALKI